MNEILLYLSYKYKGNWELIYKALETKEIINEDLAKKIHQKFKNNYLTILDENYPMSLKKIYKPPFVIFYKGNVDLLQETNHYLWIFGSYITSQIKKSVQELKKSNWGLVSGYFDFFEKEVINDNKQKLILVKNFGIFKKNKSYDEIEDYCLLNNGLVISEYPTLILPNIKTWNDSNRIKIGLCDGLFLINSLKNIDLFKIIAESIEQGKEIFCLKSQKNDINNHNNILIEKGAIEILKIPNIENG